MYHSEHTMKNEFLRLCQIEKMNEDLRNLLINLPNPILLFDHQEKNVVLANRDLYKLLSVEETEDNKAISDRISEQIFIPYNYIEGLGDNENQDTQDKI